MLSPIWVKWCRVKSGSTEITGNFFFFFFFFFGGGGSSVLSQKMIEIRYVYSISLNFSYNRIQFACGFSSLPSLRENRNELVLTSGIISQTLVQHIADDSTAALAVWCAQDGITARTSGRNPTVKRQSEHGATSLFVNLAKKS